MYKYTIKAYDIRSQEIHQNRTLLPRIINYIEMKVKAVNEHIALQKAKQIVTRAEYNIIEIEEL